MTIQTEIQKVAVSPLVELFTLDLTGIGGSVLKFTPNTVGGSSSVSFGGQVFAALPITGSGWETSIDGAPPRPMLKVSNVTRFIQSYLNLYADLVGAIVTRTVTLEKFLDSGSSPDSSQVLFSDKFRISQKSKQNKKEVEFVLSSVLDTANFKLPRRQVLRTTFPGAGLFRK
jgi:lambda family phage minor tail protein L